jgi:hypothetical protein
MIGLHIYRAILLLAPRSFRIRFGREMTEIARERIAVEGWRTVIAECSSLSAAVMRLRLRHHPVQAPALVVVALLLLMLRGEATSASTVDFQATDPAGEFTISVRDGRVISGTIDRQPLQPGQLVHAGDSIRVLSANGRVLFAVAYDRTAETIEWEARPAHCRGRALECGGGQ